MASNLLTLKSPLGDALIPIKFSGSDYISQPFEFRVEVVSRRSDIAAQELLGQTIAVGIDDGRGRTRDLAGYCTRVQRGGAHGRYSHYRIVVRPGLWFLTRNADCRVFQDMTVPEIVRTVLAVSGKQKVEARLSATYSPWKYCVQYRETDLNFVSRLLEQEGIYYAFEHAGGNHTMVLYDVKTAHRTLRQPVLAFRPLTHGAEALRDHIRTWQHTEEYSHHRYSLSEYDYLDPNRDLFVSRLRDGEAQGSFYEMYDYPGEYDMLDEGERYVGSRIEEMLAQAETFEASGAAFDAAPGMRFRLAEHPSPAFNNEYLITSVRYECTDPLPESGALTGASFGVGLTAIRFQRQFRPPRVTPKPIVQGVQTATVVGPSGEEIYTDPEGLGRVKVQFHWDRYGKRDDKSSCWVRVAYPWANQNFGFVAIPRVGSEVVVSFEEGDPDRPLITGSVYNGINRPPYAVPANKTQSGIKTHTMKGGDPNFNELRFEDKQGSELVFLQAEKDQQLLIKNDRIVHVKRDRHENVIGDAYLATGKQLHEKIGSDRMADVGGSVSMKAAQDTLVKTGMRFNADAGQEIHLKAGMNVTVEAGVNLTLKVGGNFVSINPVGVFIQGTMVMINSGGAAGSGSGAPVKSPKMAAKSPEGTALVRKPLRPPKPKTFRPSTESMKRGAAAGAAVVTLTEASPAAPYSSGLGDKTDAIINKSPTLVSNLDALQRDGWTISYGEAGKGTYCDKAAKRIVVDPNKKNDPSGVVQSLAHESGHALYKEEPYVQPTGLTKAEYVDRNVARHLKDEGEATLTNAQIRNEILKNKGPDIGIAGSQAAEYAKVAEKHTDLKDRDKARQEIAAIFADKERPSTDPTVTYRDYYAKTYRDHYDKVTKK